MRRAGILLPLFSLPSPYGIGTMGQSARDFIDFLTKAGQSCWQVLPVGPTSFGDSPYQSFSSFAGNPYFIDLDDLAAEGLLNPREYNTLDWGDSKAVDYALLYQNRYPVLRKACQRLLGNIPADYTDFLAEHAFWLEDYALFMSLKGSHGGQSWTRWEPELRHRDPVAMAAARAELAEEVSFWQAVQYLFYHQWDALKALANEKSITIIGDLPIYVALDSADVWADPQLFQLDEHLAPTEVAGCPPDAFTADGQLWGNPLFNWVRMAENGYAWWMRRIKFQFRICDTLRIDHFRGFDEYYAIPYGDSTARNGRWKTGPGKDFFHVLNETLGPRSIIAEDLGYLTQSVKELLAYTGYPGMKILQFGFDSREPDSSYLPHCCPTNCVLYSGTHDNDTVVSWLNTITEEDRAYAIAYMRLTEAEGWHKGIARTIWSNTADLTILQMQDILGLGNEARINTPSTLGCNWKWRLLPGQCSDTLARELRTDMALYGRLP